MLSEVYANTPNDNIIQFIWCVEGFSMETSIGLSIWQLALDQWVST